MLQWLFENIGTILAGLVVTLAVTGAVIVLVRDRKKGKSSCGAGCAHCSMAGKCHKSK